MLLGGSSRARARLFKSNRPRRGVAQEKKDEKGADSDEFVPPDFDEDAFIHKEMVSFRTTTILFLWGIVAALATWGVFAAMEGRQAGWFIGLAICAAFGFALKWIFPLLKADIKHFARREWMGTGALFFFTWLAFVLITVNPPVSDFASPRVDLYASPYAQDPSGEVEVHLFVEDNVKVESHTFRLTQGATVLATQGDLRDLGRGHHLLTIGNLTPGTYRLEATATDARGHEGAGSLEFAVSEGLLSFDAPGAANELAGPADRVLVMTDEGLPACKARKGTVTTRDACVRTVRLEMVGGGNVTLAYNKDEEAWTGTTELAGWTLGNNTFDVVAELADRYSGSVRFSGGEVRDGPHTVQVSGTLGDEVVVPWRDPGPHQRDVPGLGLPLLAGALVAAALVLHRRRA